ncbi:hypothetical protein PROFUN_00498 [Planoprotostelium fungivorum]|uniref:UBC core domain-containing protein n=1 Tax=Planoprotostelium fungivorum TaxID=1890364 RepID=A0A2P6N102_9EUKA|nr:hypothetical protein PROFUN_00498 [Planoprotostelium fungivorum]
MNTPQMSKSTKTSQAALRLMSDLKELSIDPPEGVSASPVSDNDLFIWNATIMGPDETPWEGIFHIILGFTEDYPSKPPRDVRFTTHMYHPNVYSDGSLCLDIIQDKWNPTYTVATLLTSIQSLLTDPNPNSPANPEAARLYNSDKKEYNKRVRKYAARSAE